MGKSRLRHIVPAAVLFVVLLCAGGLGTLLSAPTVMPLVDVPINVGTVLADGPGYTYSGGVLTLLGSFEGGDEILQDNLNYILSGSVTNGTRRVVVASGAETTVTLNGLTISGSGLLQTESPFDIQSGAVVNLVLAEGKTNTFAVAGANDLTRQVRAAVVHVPEGAEVIISGEGKINANGSSGSHGGSDVGGSAGIGGNSFENAGKITIKSGTIVASGAQVGWPGQQAGAAIGGGKGGTFELIVIEGGSVTTSGAIGAGGDCSLESGDIYITGDAVVEAVGYRSGGRAIGGQVGGYIEISGNAVVNASNTGLTYNDGIQVGWGGELLITDSAAVSAYAGGAGGGYTAGIGNSAGGGSSTITITIDTTSPLTAVGNGGYGGPGIGIGGNSNNNAKMNLLIDGSTVLARAEQNSNAAKGPGIGGYGGGAVNIVNGAVVTAYGSNPQKYGQSNSRNSNGIGGSYDVTVEDSTVTAYSGGDSSSAIFTKSLTITNSTVYAYGANGKMIADKIKTNSGGITSDVITINSGTVYAEGNPNGQGCGIGADNYGNTAKIYIYGGTVYAEGFGYYSGMSASTELVISGSAKVTAIANGSGAAIGGSVDWYVGSSEHQKGTITIDLNSAGSLYAEAKGNGAAIGGGGAATPTGAGKNHDKIVILGGDITAIARGYGAAIGSGGAVGGNAGGVASGGKITIKDASGLKLTTGTNAALIGGGGSESGNGGAGSVEIDLGGGTLELVNDMGTGAAIGGGGSGGGTSGTGTVRIKSGIVIATANGEGSGIGGGGSSLGSSSTGTVTIDAGNVTATAAHGAGIGGGDAVVVINGGTVSATGGNRGAGIGGGHGGSPGASGSITINNGDVTAISGGNGAGIGGGTWPSDRFLNQTGGAITINNGTVYAESKGNGAGIGYGGSASGDLGQSGSTYTYTINVKGGEVTAKSAGGAGIGGASTNTGTFYSQRSVVNISNGTVTAAGGGNSAGIGMGTYAAYGATGSGTVYFADITVSGGTVKANGSGDGAGIGIGGSAYTHKLYVTLSGGNITATAPGNGAGIGGGGFTNGDVQDVDGLRNGNSPGIQISGSATVVSAASNGNGAGIGGGGSVEGIGGRLYSGAGYPAIRITAGTVTAASKGNGAGIGTGGSVNGRGGALNSDNMAITGGSVTAASYGNGAGIGSGGSVNGNGGSNMKISNLDGTIYAESKGSGAGIGAGGSINGNGGFHDGPICINGSVTAVGGPKNGAGIGGGGSVNGTGGYASFTLGAKAVVVATGGWDGAGTGGAGIGAGGSTLLAKAGAATTENTVTSGAKIHAYSHSALPALMTATKKTGGSDVADWKTVYNLSVIQTLSETDTVEINVNAGADKAYLPANYHNFAVALLPNANAGTIVTVEEEPRALVRAVESEADDLEVAYAAQKTLAAADNYAKGSQQLIENANIPKHSQYGAAVQYVMLQPLYTLRYDLNGGETAGGGVSIPVSRLTRYGSATVAPAIVKKGFTFGGWKVSAVNPAVGSAVGVSLTAGGSFSPDAAALALPYGIGRDITISAEFTANKYAYQIEYYKDDDESGNLLATVSGVSELELAELTEAGIGEDLGVTGWVARYMPEGYNARKTTVTLPPTLNKSGVTVVKVVYRHAYNVIYDANGGVLGENPPVDGAVYLSGEQATVLGEGSLQNAGFTFIGWNTASGGAGTGYASGSKIAVDDDDITLYAQWAATEYAYRVDYYKDSAAAANLLGQRNGGKALDYNKLISAEKISEDIGANWQKLYLPQGYLESAQVVFPAEPELGDNGDVKVIKVIYAKAFHVVYVNLAAGVTGALPEDANAYGDGDSFAVAAGRLTRPGYEFVGWNTNPNGTGTAFKAGDAGVISGANVTLYAQWTRAYQVVYLPNGADWGSVPRDDASYADGAAFTVLAGDISRTGYTFAGWNTRSDGGGVAYAVGAQGSINGADVTLYAQWEREAGPITTVAPGAGATPAPTSSSEPTSSPEPAPSASTEPEALEPSWTPRPVPEEAPPEIEALPPTIEIALGGGETTGFARENLGVTEVPGVFELFSDEGRPLGYVTIALGDDGEEVWIMSDEFGNPLGAAKVNPVTGVGCAPVIAVAELIGAAFVAAYVWRRRASR